MKAIQFILIPLLIIVAVIYFKKLQSKLLDRAILLLLTSLAILMVLFPDAAQSLAHTFGVGRGADLVMYLGFVVMLFFNLLLLSKTRQLEEDLTKVARDQAIRDAKTP